MRAQVLFLVFVLAGLCAPGDALADKVRTNQSTKLFARPGERAKVLLKVKEGQNMTVLAKQGRWLKVRVSGRTGYVAQSTIEMPERGEIARNSRRRPFVDGRGTRRSFGSESGPDDRVGADALGEGLDEEEESGGDEEEEEEPAPKKPVKQSRSSRPDPEDEEEDEPEKPSKSSRGDDDDFELEDEEDPIDEEEEEEEGDEEEEEGDDRVTARVSGKTDVFAEPDDESDVEFTAKPDMILYPTGNKKGKFTEVENDEGDIGYVLSSELEIDGEEGMGGPKRREIGLRVRAGATYVTQGLRTPNGITGPPDNYNIKTAAATFALGGSYMRPYKGKFMIGAEASYDFAKAFPGVATPMNKKAAIAIHDIHVRGQFGYDLKKKNGMMILGRLGLRYYSFQVPDVENLAQNTATLPSEIIISPMLGAGVAMPRLTEKIGLRFTLDAVLFNASYSQTKNLEDGKSPASKGVLFGAGFTYGWKKDMAIQANYDLDFSKASFGAKVDNSQRMHPGGSVSRTDVIHQVTVGVNKAF